jgi:hypothetical protein
MRNDDRACPGGCYWEPHEGDLCSNCAVLKSQLCDFLEQVETVTKAALGRLLDEIRAEGTRRHPKRRPQRTTAAQYPMPRPRGK